METVQRLDCLVNNILFDLSIKETNLIGYKGCFLSVCSSCKFAVLNGLLAYRSERYALFGQKEMAVKTKTHFKH